MRIKTLAVIAGFVCLAAAANAQKAPIKFGKVSEEELQMTAYEPDTSAAAVILCQYGYFNGNEFKFYLTRRIKVLKKEGVDMIDYIFKGYDDASVRGKTYNLENGKIVEDKLKSESIFKEKLYGDYYQYRVAMPNIKVGSVVDIETSEFALPEEFRFQDLLPVKHSELVLEENSYIEYRKRAVGYGQIPSSGNNRFVMQDVKAFKQEPYMDSPENYIAKFEFDLLRVSFPGYYKSYSTTWEAVNKRLRESDYFGGVLTNSSGYLSDIANEIKAKYTAPLDKMTAAYEAIKKVKWDNKVRLASSTNTLSSVYKKGVANSAEINMMLYQLLQRLDLNAWPVVISTRENGTLNLFSPSFNKLNSTIVCCIVDDKEYLMDASEQCAPFGLLPERCLNLRGRLVNNGDGRWVNLTTDKTEKEIIIYEVELSDDLKIKGTLKKQKTEYAALDFRNTILKAASKENFINQLESQNPGLLVKNYEFTMLDSIHRPVQETYEIEISNKAEKMGDVVLLNPYLLEQITQNPFKTDKRTYPVDFGYSREKTVTIKIKIPEGYTISEIPKPVKISTPQNGATAMINVASGIQELMVVAKIQIKKTNFSPEEYEYLQELYNQVIKKQAEPIILKPVVNAAQL
ncbi:MAG: DUF3857 domain-containing protein [Breznakibacter sp.]